MVTKEITAYTDGACRDNPGPGSYGAIIFNSKNKIIHKRGGHRKKTTNNEMELGAIYIAVDFAIKNGAQKLSVYTDSKYAINSLTKWMFGWQKNAWKTKQGKSVKNQHILRPLAIMLKKVQVDFHHVPGHSGHPHNDAVDELCNQILDEHYPDTIPYNRR